MNRQLLNAVLDSLNNHPEEWHFSRYEATNAKRKIVIWISNSLYGLNVNGVGGVTMASSLFGWLIPWRVRIWRAVWRAKAAQIVSAAA